VQRTVADVTARLQAARAAIIENVGRAYDLVVTDRDPTDAVARARLAFAHAGIESIRAVDEIVRVVGTPAAHLSSPLQRRLRDLMVAQHFPAFDVAIHQNAGRVLLGLQPEGSGW
jgi:alkylation response protein AidB-like acyl-CoA dehydrogenase